MNNIVEVLYFVSSLKHNYPHCPCIWVPKQSITLNLQGPEETTSKTYIMLTIGKKNKKRVLFHHLLPAQLKLPTLRCQALTHYIKTSKKTILDFILGF